MSQNSHPQGGTEKLRFSQGYLLALSSKCNEYNPSVNGSDARGSNAPEVEDFNNSVTCHVVGSSECTGASDRGSKSDEPPTESRKVSVEEKQGAITVGLSCPRLVVPEEPLTDGSSTLSVLNTRAAARLDRIAQQLTEAKSPRLEAFSPHTIAFARTPKRPELPAASVTAREELHRLPQSTEVGLRDREEDAELREAASDNSSSVVGSSTAVDDTFDTCTVEYSAVASLASTPGIGVSRHVPLDRRMGGTLGHAASSGANKTFFLGDSSVVSQGREGSRRTEQLGHGLGRPLPSSVSNNITHLAFIMAGDDIIRNRVAMLLPSVLGPSGERTTSVESSGARGGNSKVAFGYDKDRPGRATAVSEQQQLDSPLPKTVSKEATDGVADHSEEFRIERRENSERTSDSWSDLGRDRGEGGGERDEDGSNCVSKSTSSSSTLSPANPSQTKVDDPLLHGETPKSEFARSKRENKSLASEKGGVEADSSVHGTLGVTFAARAGIPLALPSALSCSEFTFPDYSPSSAGSTGSARNIIPSPFSEGGNSGAHQSSRDVVRSNTVLEYHGRHWSSRGVEARVDAGDDSRSLHKAQSSAHAADMQGNPDTPHRSPAQSSTRWVRIDPSRVQLVPDEPPCEHGGDALLRNQGALHEVSQRSAQRIHSITETASTAKWDRGSKEGRALKLKVPPLPTSPSPSASSPLLPACLGVPHPPTARGKSPANIVLPDVTRSDQDDLFICDPNQGQGGAEDASSPHSRARVSSASTSEPQGKNLEVLVQWLSKLMDGFLLSALEAEESKNKRKEPSTPTFSRKTTCTSEVQSGGRRLDAVAHDTALQTDSAREGLSESSNHRRDDESEVTSTCAVRNAAQYGDSGNNGYDRNMPDSGARNASAGALSPPPQPSRSPSSPSSPPTSPPYSNLVAHFTTAAAFVINAAIFYIIATKLWRRGRGGFLAGREGRGVRNTLAPSVTQSLSTPNALDLGDGVNLLSEDIRSLLSDEGLVNGLFQDMPNYGIGGDIQHDYSSILDSPDVSAVVDRSRERVATGTDMAWRREDPRASSQAIIKQAVLVVRRAWDLLAN